MYILVYDSKCIFCCTFVKYLNFFADQRNKGYSPLYIISPDDIIKIKKLNLDLYQNLDKNKIKILSNSTIIFLSDNQLSLRINALIKIAKVLRPESTILTFIDKKLCGLFSLIFDPFYIIFAKNRYVISRFTKSLINTFFWRTEKSCITSTKRIIFL